MRLGIGIEITDWRLALGIDIGGLELVSGIWDWDGDWGLGIEDCD